MAADFGTLFPANLLHSSLYQKTKAADFRNYIGETEKKYKLEYQTTDPEISVSLENGEIEGTVLAPEFQHTLLRVLYATQNGIYRMSPDIDGLVQTSNNLARVLVKDGEFTIMCLTRSAVDSEKWDLANGLKSTFELLGSKVAFGGEYPGWTPLPGSAIVSIMRDLYTEKYKEEPDVNACHAGLECGILGRNYPGMEMISFGPNIRGAHSPDERVQVSSVQKFWDFLLDTLKQIPKK